VTTDARTAEIAANLQVVEGRLRAACAAAGRSRDDVTLIAVTKTFPADDVARLAELGVHDVGENRDQEAAPKTAALASLGLRWHFVGRLQSNKCRSVASYASVVHSVDRTGLVTALSHAARQQHRVVRVFVQVSLDGDPRRGGVPVSEAPQLADAVASADALHLLGVMAVAPLGADATQAFDRLAQVSAQVRVNHAEAAGISAGMSTDLEAAIAAGATHVRIGTALLGGRRAVVG
jgi:pyridoxal phosphate enzyme (YggS family)